MLKYLSLREGNFDPKSNQRKTANPINISGHVSVALQASENSR